MLRIGVLALVSSMFLTSSPAPAQVLSTGQPVVVDANGLLMGPVVDYDDSSNTGAEQVTLSLLIDGRPLFISLRGDDHGRLFGPNENTIPLPIAFASNDCTGQPFFLGTTALFAERLSTPYFAVNNAGLSLWVVAPGATETPFVFLSFLTTTGACDNSAGGNTTGFAAVNIATPFVPPYRLGSGALPVIGVPSVPAVSPLGLAVLAAFLVGAGVWLMRRRKNQGDFVPEG